MRRTLLRAIACILATTLLFAQPILAQPTFPAAGTVTATANLRSGPGTTFARIGSAAPGQAVTVTGCNPACDWYQLSTGQWVAAFLVDMAEAPNPPDAAQPAVPAGAVAAQVVKITDGDTIEVMLDGQRYKVRYILMNTPETDQPFGDEATAANRRLVDGKTVYLLKDVSETDRYGRLLRYVYLADGTFVNADLVRQGFAQVATYPPDIAKEAEIRAAEREAQAAQRGLWAVGQGGGAFGPASAAAVSGGALRTGPDTSYPISGSVAKGQALALTGRNAAGDWLQTADGKWIAAFLVTGAPTNLPVVQVPASPAPAPAATPAAPGGDSRSGAVDVGAAESGYLRIVSVDKRDEYVVVRNDGAAGVNLRGWTLVSEKGNQAWTVPFDFVLAPGAVVTIHALTGQNDGANLYSGFEGNIWNNGEPDAAVLVDGAGNVVSRVE